MLGFAPFNRPVARLFHGRHGQPADRAAARLAADPRCRLRAISRRRCCCRSISLPIRRSRCCAGSRRRAVVAGASHPFLSARARQRLSAPADRGARLRDQLGARGAGRPQRRGHVAACRAARSRCWWARVSSPGCWSPCEAASERARPRHRCVGIRRPSAWCGRWWRGNSRARGDPQPRRPGFPPASRLSPSADYRAAVRLGAAARRRRARGASRRHRPHRSGRRSGRLRSGHSCRHGRARCRLQSRGHARFVFMSSVRAQSGACADGVLTETDAPRPTEAYGRAKLAAEAAVEMPTSPGPCCGR